MEKITLKTVRPFVLIPVIGVGSILDRVCLGCLVSAGSKQTLVFRVFRVLFVVVDGSNGNKQLLLPNSLGVIEILVLGLVLGLGLDLIEIFCGACFTLDLTGSPIKQTLISGPLFRALDSLRSTANVLPVYLLFIKPLNDSLY